MTSGYSGTPLIKKLGIKSGMRLLLVNTPDHYLDLLGPLPEDCLLQVESSPDKADFIHLFCDTKKQQCSKPNWPQRPDVGQLAQREFFYPNRFESRVDKVAFVKLKPSRCKSGCYWWRLEWAKICLSSDRPRYWMSIFFEHILSSN